MAECHCNDDGQLLGGFTAGWCWWPVWREPLLQSCEVPLGWSECSGRCLVSSLLPQRGEPAAGVVGAMLGRKWRLNIQQASFPFTCSLFSVWYFHPQVRLVLLAQRHSLPLRRIKLLMSAGEGEVARVWGCLITTVQVDCLASSDTQQISSLFLCQWSTLLID